MEQNGVPPPPPPAAYTVLFHLEMGRKGRGEKNIPDFVKYLCFLRKQDTF